MMEQTRIFIGSSKRRAPLVNRLAAALQRRGFAATRWQAAFPASTTFVDNLVTLLNRNEFFVLLITPDDELADGRHVARDNVVLEAGAALGRHGLPRTILVRDKRAVGLTDLSNVNVIEFDIDKGDRQIAMVAEKISGAVERQLRQEKNYDKRIRWLSLIECAPTGQRQVLKRLADFEKQARDEWDVRYERHGVLWGPPDNFLLFSVPTVKDFTGFVTRLRQSFKPLIQSVDSRLVFPESYWRPERNGVPRNGCSHLVMLSCMAHHVEDVFETLVRIGKGKVSEPVRLTYVAVATGDDDVFFITAGPSVVAHQNFIHSIGKKLPREWLSRNTTSMLITGNGLR